LLRAKESFVDFSRYIELDSLERLDVGEWMDYLENLPEWMRPCELSEIIESGEEKT